MSASSVFDRRLNALTAADGKRLVHQGRRIGIEKESLRMNRDGHLAKTPHPPALGSALTHPYITTDYSEALLEFVVPPLPGAREALEFLQNVHAAVIPRLAGGELLWPASMPCIVRTEADIPLAYYGTSNAGRMKTIYRSGLGHRYGRPMQTIAGVHFNYSFGDELWQVLRDNDDAGAGMREFRSRRYMDLLRNFLRLGWMIPYLFGTSPAVCRTFIGTAAGSLQAFDESTLYRRHATSLRMGDIGYQNNQEAKTGVKASYNGLSRYVDSLVRAVTTESDKYKRIGVNVGGEYRQLSACILQVENEYYSTVRPKHPANKDEMPLVTLQREGVAYVELRSLDVNIFEPAGISLEQLHFLEAMMLFCLLQESPAIEERDWREIDGNEVIAAHEGRRPGLDLVCGGGSRPLRQWGLEVCDRMRAVSELLDGGSGGNAYRNALERQRRKFEHPEYCPSARLLDAMRDEGLSFVAFSERQARRFRDHFSKMPPAHEQQAEFDRTARQSLRDQSEIESKDGMSLDNYIKSYFAPLARLRPAVPPRKA